MDKRCYKCGKTKSIDEFGNHKGRPDGHRAECKECTKKIQNEWYSKNKNHIKLFRRKYFIQSGYNQKNRRNIKGLVKRDYPKDGYCEICRKNNKRLAYHHWDDKNPSKGIWMCAGCHIGSNFVEKDAYLKRYWELRKIVEDNYNPDLSNIPMNIGDMKK